MTYWFFSSNSIINFVHLMKFWTLIKIYYCKILCFTSHVSFNSALYVLFCIADVFLLFAISISVIINCIVIQNRPWNKCLKNSEHRTHICMFWKSRISLLYKAHFPTSWSEYAVLRPTYALIHQHVLGTDSQIEQNWNVVMCLNVILRSCTTYRSKMIKKNNLVSSLH